MSFGQVQLEKYGWNKGEGIGRGKHGIKRAITVSKKYDLYGIGVNREDSSGSWWDRLYNNTCQKVKNESSSKLDSSADTLSDKTTTTPTLSLDQVAAYNMGLGLYGGMFVKASSTLTTTPPVKPESNDTDSVANLPKKSEFSSYTGKNLTDEQLFEICGKRVANKGARADFSGKLARLDRFENLPDPKIVQLIDNIHSNTILSSTSNDLNSLSASTPKLSKNTTESNLKHTSDSAPEQKIRKKKSQDTAESNLKHTSDSAPEQKIRKKSKTSELQPGLKDKKKSKKLAEKIN
ncbi:hypothetical protein BB561_004017 [Smittium simulii]|uniref:G-patch domain-containing protein n=1 Tax=Smittium simulii TaxID=133385 RepID=A0A2T9YIJ0_9FUNG|nr:hypothetical protein BB561_004017 [Smittium simulii]